MNIVNAALLRFFLILIKIYQYCISPFTPRACRFYPSCSEYASQALLQYGLILGIKLTLKRLMKCQPFSSHSGWDPVDSSSEAANVYCDSCKRSSDSVHTL